MIEHFFIIILVLFAFFGYPGLHLVSRWWRKRQEAEDTPDPWNYQ